jgi:D-alanyl-D-alanine carboxypeptidase
MDQVLWLSVVLDPDKPLAPQDVLATVADDPMEFEPGTACRYSNTNYILLGLVIEAASGQPAHEEIRDRVVIPLGLEHTYLDVEGKEDFRLAHGYMDPRMAFMELDVSPDLIALIPKDLLAEEGLVDCTYLSHPSISWTAGALVTTPRDMTRMVRSLVGGALVSGEMLAQRMDSGPCEIVAETSDYGLGLMAWDTPLGRAFGHGGLMYGYSGKTGFVEEADVAYSYAVGSYPAQEELLVDEALSLLAAPGSMEIPAACRPPDGMLEPAADTDRLSLRFRGRLGSQEEDAAPGMANLTAYLGQSRYLLHGKGTRALLVAGSEGLADTVQVDSYGPPRTGKSHASRCLLTLSAALWDDDPDAHTLDLPEAAAPADAWLWDVWEDPESAQPVRECVVAVRDTTKPSHLYRCDPGMPAEAGRLLRLYGSFVLTQEPAALQSALARTGAPQCRCLADGAWDECP